MNDQTRTGVFFRISVGQKEMLNKICRVEERTLQSVFIRAIREYVERNHEGVVPFINGDEPEFAIPSGEPECCQASLPSKGNHKSPA